MEINQAERTINESCANQSKSEQVNVMNPAAELPVLGNLEQVLPPLHNSPDPSLGSISDSLVQVPSSNCGGRMSPDSSMDWNGNEDNKLRRPSSSFHHTLSQPDSTWPGSVNNSSPTSFRTVESNYDSDAFDSDASDESYIELERNPNLISEILSLERKATTKPGTVVNLDKKNKDIDPTTKTKKRKIKRAGNVVLNCTLCNYTTLFKEHLTSHMNTHNEKRNFMCSDCGQTFKWSHSLKRHQRTHQTNFKRFSCSFCFKEFSRKDHLSIHENLHRNSSVAFPCALCGASFKNKKTLSGHLKTHSSEREFACDRCDSAFTRRSSLTRHFDRVHSGKVIPCPLCPSTFSYRSTLEDHKKAAHNDGKREFTCSLCGIQFAVKAYLSKHRITCQNRSEGKMFSCQQCSKEFPSKRHLNEHMRRKHDTASSLCTSTTIKKDHLTVHQVIDQQQYRQTRSVPDKTELKKSSICYDLMLEASQLPISYPSQNSLALTYNNVETSTNNVGSLMRLMYSNTCWMDGDPQFTHAETEQEYIENDVAPTQICDGNFYSTQYTNPGSHIGIKNSLY